MTSVTVVRNNPLITELWLGGNMLQSELIHIASGCKSLTNLQALDLSYNSISPVEVIHLASLVTNIKSLHVLVFGGLVLNLKERLQFCIFQVHGAHKKKLVLLNSSNSSDSEILEIAYLEIWGLNFARNIKFCFDYINFFSTSIETTQVMLVDAMHNFSTALSIAKQAEQKLPQLDATNMISSLSSIIKTLKVLDLEYSNIKKEAAVKLATALNCNNVLEQLWLRGNGLSADGAGLILTSLQHITTLRILDLSYNISSRSANGIAAVINNNHFLEQLWLDSNELLTIIV